MDVAGEGRAWIAAILDHTTLAIRDPDPIRNEVSDRADVCPGPRSAVAPMSCVQKQCGVFYEQRGILVLRPVIGIWIEDELRIRDVLRRDVGVDRGHDHVVTAVHECWLLYRPQIGVGPLL